METSTRIAVPGTFNFRDVGGLPTATGRVRSGVFFRSDGLHNLGDAGRDALRELGVGMIIDLRDDAEANIMPDDLDGLDVVVKRLPVFEGSSQSMAGITLDALYERIVTQHTSTVIDALRDVLAAAHLPEGHRASIVHCTAGKDRTGIVTAVALLAVGVSRDDVIDDYAATEENLSGEWLTGMLAKVAEYGIPDSPQLRTLMGGSPREAIAGVIDLIEREHGSVREYLIGAGFELAELAELERVLVES